MSAKGTECVLSCTDFGASDFKAAGSPVGSSSVERPSPKKNSPFFIESSGFGGGSAALVGDLMERKKEDEKQRVEG